MSDHKNKDIPAKADHSKPAHSDKTVAKAQPSKPAVMPAKK